MVEPFGQMGCYIVCAGVAMLFLLIFNPVLQLNYISPKLFRFQQVPVIPCPKVNSIVAINSFKHVVDDGIPSFPYRCVPGPPFHSV